MVACEDDREALYCEGDRGAGEYGCEGARVCRTDEKRAQLARSFVYGGEHDAFTGERT